MFKSKVEHTFICVFAIPISFSVNFWFLFACLSLDLLVFFLLICLSSLEIKEINPLSQVLQISCCLSFVFWLCLCIFLMCRNLNFYGPHIWIFLLISRLVACLQRPSPYQDYMYLNMPIFSFSTFKVSFFTLKSLIHL